MPQMKSETRLSAAIRSRHAIQLEPEKDWRIDASCNDPEVARYHCNDGGWYVTRAKSFCSTCPVKQECLDFALANDERHGIWGGLSAMERLPLLPDIPRGTQRIDEVAVLQILGGTFVGTPRIADRREAVKRVLQNNELDAVLAERLGVSRRQIGRARAKQRAAGVPS